MKRLVFLAFILFPFIISAQSWGDTSDKTTSFFDSGNKTQIIMGKDDEKQSQNKNSLSTQEATWSVDIEALNYIMPDQPAPDQMLSAITGAGTTYKFSDTIQLVGKYMTFSVEAAGGVVWDHKHYLGGFGGRGFFANNSQQWQINLMTGMSEVKGNGDIGTVKNTETPIFLDIKYFWAPSSTFMVGPQITFGRVANKCEDPNGRYTECGHAGYTSIALVIQFGIPEDWGQ